MGTEVETQTQDERAIEASAERTSAESMARNVGTSVTTMKGSRMWIIPI